MMELLVQIAVAVGFSVIFAVLLGLAMRRTWSATAAEGRVLAALNSIQPVPYQQLVAEDPTRYPVDYQHDTRAA